VLQSTDRDVDAVQAVRQLADDYRVAIGYKAAQLSCVIEANFPGLDKDRIENLAIEFAHKLFMAQQDH
jgi:glutamate mutase epsilon subunit